MANELRAKNITKANFTCTLASLANGSGRQTTLLDNSATDYPMAEVTLKIRLGGDPTAAGWINVFLIRGNDPASSDYRSDAAGASDAAWTRENAELVESIEVPSSKTTNDYVGKIFIVGSMDRPLGPEWGLGIDNRSGVALHGTEGDHFKGYSYLVPELQ